MIDAMVEPRIVVAAMEPIHAKRIRWDRLIPAGLAPTTAVGDARKVDQANDITRAMRDRVPWMTDDQLVELRAFLTSRGTQATGILVRHTSDVDAWIAMVDDETRQRARMRKASLLELIELFDTTEAR